MPPEVDPLVSYFVNLLVLNQDQNMSHNFTVHLVASKFIECDTFIFGMLITTTAAQAFTLSPLIKEMSTPAI